MTIQDQVFAAITAWKENRGGQPQPDSMQSIINVLQNRAIKRGTDLYTEATRKLQFSSLTAPGDPELTLWPADSDPQWQMALRLAQQAASELLVDITSGSTLYYAPQGQKWAARFTLPDGDVIPFPDSWNAAAVKYVATIGSQVFFTEQ